MHVCVCTDVDPQAQQVMHCAAHATGGGRMERGVGFLVLTVDLCSAGHQQLHHLQMAWNRGGKGENYFSPARLRYVWGFSYYRKQCD